MIYRALMLFLIFNELMCILVFTDNKMLLDIMEAALLILGFIAIGVLLALAI